MDSEIEKLLDKYWKCETSLEEEATLRTYFQNHSVPDDWKDTAAMFQYFEAQKQLTLNDNAFDDRVRRQMKTTEPKGKSVSMVLRVARMAAGIVVLVAAGYFVRQEVRKSYPPEIADTYTDPKIAFEETKKALMMISNGFGKAQRETEKIKIFNEAEEKIQSPESNKEEVKESSI
ncbi:MAG: hypothetical protein AB7K37_05420 [Cyclobacteriaceae bacterium]